MKRHWFDKMITYDGTQLRSRWIFENTGVAGDAIASFIGPADVPIENMVDMEDVRNNAPIFSNLMLHFLCEHIGPNLLHTIALQRLLVAITDEEIRRQKNELKLIRRGDDLYVINKKLSVSIAAKSPVSCCIHFALNIDSKDTPVPTIGLGDIDIDPKKLADVVMKKYCEEIESMQKAETKVRSIN